MATAMPAAKGLGPGDQSIVPDEDSRQSRSKQNSVSAPSAAQGSAQAGQAGSASSSQHPNDRDRKIGHRRVNENGEVSYKKVTTNQLMGSIQLGIGHAIGALAKADDRDLLMQDFMTVETTHFPKNGSQQTPAHSFSEYTFRTYAPLAFRYFLNLFGIQREDFLVSLVNYNMRELSNPGASGSIFYLTYDDEFILKTVQHKEAEFLQKLLPGYYMNLNQNPHTLLPKFFGMYMYQCNQKNIRVIIMNNLLPSNIKMHMKFDLKGSTFKRKAGKHERSKSSPTYKDLDFMELLPEGLMLEAETYNALITTMRRDCRVLESFRIMDYSLLIGVHNLDQSAKEQAESISGVSPTKEQARREAERKMQQYATKQKLVSGPMESIQAQTEPIDEQDHLPPGGIPARNHKGERLLLYLGIIDILQSYRMRKKIEHVFKAMLHDGDTVSVHRPGFYAHRFLDFMADKVFKKIPSPLKHSPSKRGKRDSIKKIVQDKSEKVAAEQLNTTGASSLEVAEASANASSSSPPQPSNELGQLRGAAAIGVSLKSSKLFAAAAAAHNSSLETENNSEDASEAACGEPEKQPPQPQSPLQPPSSSQFPIQQQQPHSLQTASSQMVTFEDKTVFLESEAAAAAAAASIMLQNSGCSLAAGGPETLNIPAVLWDRPSGSSKRVPPPVPPRSPRRPYDHEASFAAATDVTRGQRPDVVPGSVDDSTADSEESGIVAGTSSFRHHHNSGGKPKHKRQDQVQQSLSYNHSRSSVDS